MPSCSEGIAYLNHLSSNATPDREKVATSTLPYPQSPDPTLGEVITARIAEAELQNHAAGQRGRSWALPGRPPVLCWSGRQRWLISVDVALLSDEGRRLCAEQGISLKAARGVARGCADFADSRTGRHLTASNATIGARAAKLVGRAKAWCDDVVTRTRSVLKQLGLAVEVVRGRYLSAAERLAAAVHHDGVQLRAASTWALTSSRRWQVKSDLPRRGSTGSKTPRSRTSPTRAQTRAQAPSGRSPRPRNGPRPLSAQKVAAQLVARVPSLDAGQHLGAMIDVLAELVDCERWTGGDIAKVLDEDARENPRDWPGHIHSPAAFLRHRLKSLSARLDGPSPSQAAADHRRAVRAEQRERDETDRHARAHRASSTHVARAMAQIRHDLATRRAARDASPSGRQG